ncbi:MAG: hypothetical protein NUV74_05370 [Candidatus Brocadiaceae bacterium]|nr:hypothetical protein [Candidatus Brocadiaceae bacterium]
MTFNDFFYILFHPFAMLGFGLITHFGRRVLAASTHGTENLPSITDYWKKNPLNSLLSIVGAIVGYALFVHFPDFDKMAPDIQNVVRSTAFGVGFLADNIADAVGQRVTDKIKGG